MRRADPPDRCARGRDLMVGADEVLAAGGGNEHDSDEVRAAIGESDRWQLALDIGGGRRSVELPAQLCES